MSCRGCYDGCTEITSDKCVKYTGENVLDIQTNDTLSKVVDNIIFYLQTALNGVGIKWSISSDVICPLIESYLPEDDYNLVDVINATFDAICSLQYDVETLRDDVDAINSEYEVGCIAGITSSSDTHDVLQAVLNTLCSLSQSVSNLGMSLNNYVLKSEIDDYIDAHLAQSSPPSTKHYLKMVPYVAVEYYGDLSGKFDADGKGLANTDWENIYLCNGKNGTPDKRGRIPVGVTNMMGGAFHPDVDPTLNNPTYNLNDVNGTNFVSLKIEEMPAHTHTCSTSISENPHSHYAFGIAGGDNGDMQMQTFFAGADKPDGTQFSLKTSTVNLTVNTNIISTGQGVAHSNIPPVLACHYIMYIPA